MPTKYGSVVVGLLAIVAFSLNGCAKPKTESAGGESAAAHDHDHGHGHSHAEEGPHGGHIVELGAEEHHAELTHDEEGHKVGIYLLGADAKTAAPIAAESVVINVAAGGELTQYTLPAVPQEGEAGGQSSYFEIVSEPLCKVVCGESESPNTSARLSVTIDGKPFVGLLETAPHDHDHDHGHSHDHDHEAGHADDHDHEEK